MRVSRNARSSSLINGAQESRRGFSHEPAAPTVTDGRQELTQQDELIRLMASSPRLQRQCAYGAPSAGGGSCAACEATAAASPQPLQRKPLEIGAADDPLEREADRVAEQVMRMEAPTASSLHLVQPRQPLLSRATEGATSLGVAPASVHATLASPGQPPAPATRAFFEPRFGHDFSDVRVHADAQASDAAEAIRAKAFTLGRQIVFGAHHYAPETSSGRRLLAHELTHVVQQSSTDASPPGQRINGLLQRDGQASSVESFEVFSATQRNFLPFPEAHPQ